MSDARASDDESDPYLAVCPAGKWRGVTIGEILGRMATDREVQTWLAWAAGGDDKYAFQTAVRRVTVDRYGRDRRVAERRQGDRRRMHQAIGEALGPEPGDPDENDWRPVGAR
jgi:DMSO/TMAO reductase YedYZ molybdopterin-dependent catalytic subunit